MAEKSEESSFASASVEISGGKEASEDKGKKELNIEEFKKRLEECQKLKEEYLAGWQRARADLMNYKKEEMGRIGDILKYAGEGLILKILPILDNFEIAARQNFPSENKSSQEKKEAERIVQGFLQIKTQLEDFLKSQGVEEIKLIGEKFDPNFHEVVEEVEEREKKPGKIGRASCRERV